MCFLKKYLLLIFLIQVSCTSLKEVVVQENIAPQIISEMAYKEFNNKNYKKAIKYYQVIIDRFDRANYSKEVAWAYYEIGFCYYYMTKYEDAILYFDIVLNEFSVLPPRILARKVIDDIYETKPKLRPIDILEEVVEIQDETT